MSSSVASNLHVLLPLVMARVGAVMLVAPVFGSVRVPRRVRLLLAAAVSVGVLATGVNADFIPETTAALGVAMALEAMIGATIGLLVGLVLLGVQWAGSIVAQQMGLTLSEVIDPLNGNGGSPTGEMYSVLAVVVFLAIGGHRALIGGVQDSFIAVPLVSSVTPPQLLDLAVATLGSATRLAMLLAGPVLLVSLVVDVAVGLVGRAVPQLNVMASAISLRAAAGLLALLMGIGLTADVAGRAITDAMSLIFGSLGPLAR